MKTRFSQGILYVSICLLIALLTAACGSVAPSESLSQAELAMSYEAEASRQTLQSSEEEAFNTVMSVLVSPRCSNCHPVDDRPRQTDEQIMHILNVRRGEQDHGGPVQTCETCHHEENNPYSRVPGAPHWGLAPKSMGWLGLSHAEIAQALLDPTKNGDRTFDDLLHHMSEDPLVLWAWEPGEGRTPPPVPHDEFVQALQTWLDAGAPIPAQ